MTPEKWQRAKRIFVDAVDLPLRGRADFVRSAAAGDEELFDEICSLLAALDEATEFLEDADNLTMLLAKSTEESLESIYGQALGPYKLLRQLGHGGMGAVYLARRDDDQYEKLVAVKVIKRGMDTDEIVRRFVAERQILAVLDHANIGRLFDGGVTADGRPYLVMEYVDGLPITGHSDAHRLTVNERLRLFLQVCNAVQYAHRNLVVHRDLKPANIFVKADGTVKLLDFGIAKLLGDPAHSILETSDGARILTPAYAAPEQLRGRAISTATDVYSLGAVLYELLAGQKPFDVSSLSAAEAAVVVCNEPPVRLSIATRTSEHAAHPSDTVAEKRSCTSGRLRKTLHGDLENIVHLALRKEPDRRYPSVEQLANDIRRYLDGLPVHARPDTLVYRTRKFAARHRWSVSISVSMALMLIALTTMLFFKVTQVETERDKAERLATFLEDLFLKVDPGSGGGRDVTVRQALDAGAERIAVLDAYPDKQAHMLDVMGRVYRSLGEFERAEHLLTRSLVIRRAIYENGHPEIAEGLHNLAYLEYTRGNYAAAETSFVEALGYRRRELGIHHQKTIESLKDLAVLKSSQGYYDEALALLKEVLEIAPDLPATVRMDEAGTHFHVATVLREQGKASEAEFHARGAVALYQSRYGTDHIYVATTSHALATLLAELGKLEEAERMMTAVLGKYETDLGLGHPWTAAGYSAMGGILRLRGRNDEAESYLTSSLRVQRTILPASHPHLAATLLEIGELYLSSKAPAKAEPALQEAMRIREAALPAGHWRIAEARSALGEARLALGDRAQAEALIRESCRLVSSVRGEGDPETLECRRRVEALGA